MLGPPAGGGALQQSLDVVSLGNGGEIVVRFDVPVICDGPGPDFTVFENAFHAGSPTGPIFEEFGIVAVSQDGEHFVEFPYDAVTYDGLAGRTPVLSHPDNGIDPLDLAVSGGDPFDLAAVGLPWAAYVRITDPGDAIPDPGNRIPPGDKGGFDLDAMAALHACDPFAAPTPSPSFTPLPSVTPTVTPDGAPATASPTPPPDATPTATATATASPTAIPGDVDSDGTVSANDLSLLVAELFDGDGDDVRDVGGGAVASSPGADANGDGHVTGADVTGISGMRGRRER